MRIRQELQKLQEDIRDFFPTLISGVLLVGMISLFKISQVLRRPDKPKWIESSLTYVDDED